MFDGGDGESGSDPAAAWAFPGRPAPEPGPVEPDPCAVALVQAVDALLGQDAGSLPGPVARERARTVLAQAERLEVVAAPTPWSTCSRVSCSPTAVPAR